MDRVWAERGRRPDHIEGRAEGTWVLLDYSELLVHVLCEDEREYYALERLWGDCPAVPIDVDTDQARAAAAARAAAHGAESAQLVPHASFCCVMDRRTLTSSVVSRGTSISL